MSIDFLLIALIARYLQKSLQTAGLHTKWHSRLSLVFGISLTIFVAGLIIKPLATAMGWLGVLGLIGFVYLLLQNPFFKSARTVLIAILPYVALSAFMLVVETIFPKTFKSWENTLDNLSLFAIVWGLGVWVVSVRQRKELSKAQQRVLEQEEKNRMMAVMKDELEKQVAERTEEIMQQKADLEKTLNELKATQSQLVHSEKMASLGELTAGIAHEIQNPLNFVNNFSEVSKELLDEMKHELATGNYEVAREMADDVNQNLERINFHGKRAGEIVKGMLQHSRGSSGQKEPTDINALCDEYLRLSFHGLKAKDKTFNAEMKTNLDPDLPTLNVVPQDIGRVILNLITNGFYATQQRQKTMSEEERRNFKAIVSVTTALKGNMVEIRISDNGVGMPQSMVDKIFQPFFTTKPPGEGTGLGLSISYDIIHAHDGKIMVESREGEGTDFIIQLPEN